LGWSRSSISGRGFGSCRETRRSFHWWFFTRFDSSDSASWCLGSCPALPSAFATPAAYGDLGAVLLAIAASLALSRRAAWAVVLVWLFNVWGASDLLFAFYQGAFTVPLDARQLGAAFFIPTVVVPALLITHGLIFWLLIRSRQ
jgi:hypothetical protein